MRYEKADTFSLKKDARYNRILTKRKIKAAKMLKTQEINSVASVDFDMISESEVMWAQGTKLWRLAAQHYGDGSLYWIIALYNEKPTDAHWTIGDTVYIPHPYEYVVEALGF